MNYLTFIFIVTGESSSVLLETLLQKSNKVSNRKQIYLIGISVATVKWEVKMSDYEVDLLIFVVNK
ncbi:hypothetical protein SAMN05421760_105115 [Neptunomonas antarctica]|uniref:Uncharacterized protein n=1 Tax=Neptunomonas antarctica TaxID=619304 RepID=A0A1N7M2X3_9GAMM|nr:hypothetical protein SAMN05421760_105115 [Neptunomonas antarctica]